MNMTQKIAGLGTSHRDLRVVICGAGVIGTAVAYYLTVKGVKPTIVERYKVAGCASGVTGGFLAADWTSNDEIDQLARLSFSLHEQLAWTLDEDYDYRKVEALWIEASAHGSDEITSEDTGESSSMGAGIPEWIDGGVDGSQYLSGPATTAQLTPDKFTNALMHSVEKNGGKLLTGCVEGFKWHDNDDRTIRGVVVDGSVVPADVVVIAMGPWTPIAFSWLPIPQERLGKRPAEKYSSIVVKPDEKLSAHCMFLESRKLNGNDMKMEVAPRPNGEVFIGWEPKREPLPDDPADVCVDDGTCNELYAAVGSVASSLKEAPIVRQQSCYLPTSPDDIPLIGEVPGVKGVYVAAGHSIWGTLTGPATGLLMAELITDGRAETLDISAYDPARLLVCSP